MKIYLLSKCAISLSTNYLIKLELNGLTGKIYNLLYAKQDLF